MAEQLAFQKRVDHRGTIAHRQALLADGRNLVDGASDELFAGSGGTDQQNIGIVPRDFAGKVEDFKHHRAFADDAVEFEIFQELFFQRTNATPLVVQVGDIIECALEANVIERFGQEIGGAAANSLQRSIKGVACRHHNEMQAGIATQSAVRNS